MSQRVEMIEELGRFVVPQTVRVLVIEDDPEDVLILRGVLAASRRQSYQLEHEIDETIISERVAEGDFDICLLDYQLGNGLTGLELMRRCSLGDHLPVVLLTSMNEHAVDIAAMNQGVMDFMAKQHLVTAVAERTIRYALSHFHLKKQLQNMAFVDSLTQLATRRIFEFEFAKSMQRSRRDDKSFALYVIDVDDFKAVNDNYGHAAGDAVLRWCGSVFRKTVRSYDPVARMGGDEFAILVEDVSAERAGKIADVMLEEFAQGMRWKGETLAVGCSIGIAYVYARATDTEHAFALADQQVYAAKSKGKNAWSLTIWPEEGEAGIEQPASA